MGSASKQSNKKSLGGKAATADRRERIAQLRAEEERRERRNKIVAFSIAGVVLLGAVGTGVFVVKNAADKKAAQTAAAKAPIEGVKTYSNLTRNHVTTPVTYPQTPPVGGDHNPVWLNCMGTVYDKPVQNENAVHSLEHGAVWVTYNGKASAADIKTLSDKVKGTPYSLMSPYPTETGTITLTAWGTQLVVDSASDPRVEKFFTKYVQGPQTQEPGASCSTAQ
ncbi:hypothetical protein P3T37_001861 [Kitasatospora sp. MAA4]|uniref:DUF3105 domain-containing protein n=1 Tax=Kitasatospora sp. MAA4 TaxID=3035093 RepID=UPI002476B6F7|nr:DUF3105 domain-containing protein [Kitasatospora sp. MAA4]MDH6132476.1 hypothetical protein [Kitasatospora sp. MAA4]